MKRSHAYLIAGLAFGDEGKGATVDRIVRKTSAKLVVRYNGGPQCGHNVVLETGQHHCFSQFGSGTLQGASTYLSRFMLIEPFALLNEANELRKLSLLSSSGAPELDPLDRVLIESGCPIITPFHWLANRIRETSRGASRYGSCGFGVGELRADQTRGLPVLYAGDLRTSSTVRDKLETIRDQKMAEVRGVCLSFEATALFDKMFKEDIDYLSGFYRQFAEKSCVVPDDYLRKLVDGPVVFEGAQGMLLDETWGFAPYNTWTDITFTNALELLKNTGITVSRIGVLRTHFTRHGAGPFPTEDPRMEFADHNTRGPWQGKFRFGAFDAVLARYALEKIGGVDEIVFTHKDCLTNDVMEYCDSYESQGASIRSIHAPDTTLLEHVSCGMMKTASIDELAEVLQ